MSTHEQDGEGLVVVLTGKGKGKTTSALGMALRACGHGMRVLMVQFIKGGRPTGELAAAERLRPEFEIRRFGKGFVCTGVRKPSPEDVAAAQEGLAFAREAVASGRYQMVILDEINYAVRYGLVPIGDVMRLVNEKPAALHLVLTGRDAHPTLVARADLVTEMCAIKHPFDSGRKATRGIEF